jgi:pimeloyl-ACP methyl ester carboxylesterase
MPTAVSADGTNIDIASLGDGPGVVILHGAGITVGQYKHLAVRLSREFSVHAYNRRGRPGNAALTGAETAGTDIEDLAAVLAATGSTRVFGHSGGGFVALKAGLHLPLTHIGVYDPAVAVAGCDFPRDFLPSFEAALASGDQVRALTVMGADINREQAARLPESVQLAMVRAYLHTPIGRDMAQLLPTVAPELHRILDAEGPAADYAGITANVLLARGAKSAAYFGPICDELAAAIPHSEQVVIPKAHHNTANIAPEQFVKLFAQFFASPAPDATINP